MEYLESAAKTKNLAPGTVRIKRYSLNATLGGLKDLSHLTSAYIRTLRDSRIAAGYSASTVGIELRDLRTFCKWAYKERRLAVNPFIDIAIPKGREAGRKLTLDELRALYTTADARFKPFVLFLTHTGARNGEITGALWEHFDLNARTWYIPRQKSKKDRLIPMDDALFEWVGANKQADGRVFPTFTPWTANWFLKQAKKAAQIEGRVVPHDFRHSFASYWQGRATTLMQIMGWESIAMVKRYTHLDLKGVADEMQQHGIGAVLGRSVVTPKKTTIKAKDVKL